MTTQYSTVQKLSLAGMVVGAILSSVGGCAPYWLVFDPEGFGILDSLIDKVVSASMGPFIYCLEVPVLGEDACKVIEVNTSVEWLQSVRITAAVCIVMGLLCGLCALCLACCTCCQRFIVLGFLTFFAAGSGAYSAVVFSRNTDVFTKSIIRYQFTSYGWAFYVFCSGVGVLGLVSFMACFASPDHNNAVHGIVMSQPPPTQLSIISPSAPPAHPQSYGNYHHPPGAAFNTGGPSEK